MLHLICNDGINVDVQLHFRIMKFRFIIVNTTNIHARLCGQKAVNGSHSPTANTMAYIMSQI